MKIYRNFLMVQVYFLTILVAITISSCSNKDSDKEVKNQLNLVNLTTEYLSDPVGLQTDKPSFGWQFETNIRDQRQTAYQVLVASNLTALENNKGDLWNSDKIDSDRSVNIQYEGKPLESRQICYWKVRAWDTNGTVSGWSKPSRFEIALLAKTDWNAKWIGLQTPKKISPLLRKEIELTGQVKSAKVYISGLGLSELYLNGKKISDDVLSPTFTDYDQEVFYRTYDITSLLKQGPNAIGIMLGNGWFGATKIFFEIGGWKTRPQAILQMSVTYNDGTEKHFFSDETWKAASGPIGSNELKPGEDYDARLEKPQWNKVGYDDSQWSPVTVFQAPTGRLISQTIPPMKVQATFRPIKITKHENGGWLFEFDRYFGGWVRLNVKGKAGDKITIHYDLTPSFIQDEKNEKDTYILKGDPDGEVYEPRFTLHPVRYVRVEGLEAEPTLATLEGREVYSDVDLYGDFSCSNELLNQIHGNIQRSLKVALKGFIADCLNRELLAYNEPATISATLATRNFMPDIWTRFAREVQLGSSENGDLSDIVPVLPGMQRESDVSQNSSYPMLIWYLYESHGDQRLLEQHYRTVKAWVDFIGRELADSTHIVKIGWLGEHMLPKSGGEPGFDFFSKETPREFIWTCDYFQNVRVLANMSRVLGKKEAEGSYTALAKSIREKINMEWFNTKTGHYATGSQTSDILPLAIGGLVPPENQQQLIENIARTIRENDGKFKVGHIGLPGFMETLVDHGLGEVVYKAVNTTEYPGWGYMISQGATTVWEGWTPTSVVEEMDNWVYPAEESMMMLAGVGRFFYEGIVGIQEPAFYGTREFWPGYGQINIKPHVLGDLTHANATIKTVRGIISSGWKKTDNSFALDVTIPVNATAKVSVPVIGELKNPTITEGGKVVWKEGAFVKGVEGITGGKQEAGYVSFDTGSGEYRFKMQYNGNE